LDTLADLAGGFFVAGVFAGFFADLAAVFTTGFFAGALAGFFAGFLTVLLTGFFAADLVDLGAAFAADLLFAAFAVPVVFFAVANVVSSIVRVGLDALTLYLSVGLVRVKRA
jgi:hypothetical protein